MVTSTAFAGQAGLAFKHGHNKSLTITMRHACQMRVPWELQVLIAPRLRLPENPTPGIRATLWYE